MKRRLIKYAALALLAVLAVSVRLATAHAYTNSRLIDDQVFDNVSTMNQAQIQSFLVAQGSTCLANYSDIDFNWNGSSWVYGPGNISASQIIYKAAQQWGLNPQVIITTLQKEESLITGNSCDAWRYNSAMGYACPDGGGCNPKYAGFSRQVLWAAWQLKFNRERSEGFTSWDGDDNITYSGFMTQGSFARCGGCSVNFYNGYATIDGQSTYLENGATASLYAYTPHLNQSFPGIFLGWFGDPTSPCLGVSNVTGAASGYKFLAYRRNAGGLSNLALTIANNTGSTCAEMHTWNPGFTSWAAHQATAMRSSDPTLGTFVADRAKIDNQESLDYITYNGGGGHVEVHRFNPSLAIFPGYYDVSTNLTGISAGTGTFVAGDFLGRGYDQLAFVLYNGGSGHVEVHMFDPTLRTAIGYYDTITNIGAIDPTQ